MDVEDSAQAERLRPSAAPFGSDGASMGVRGFGLAYGGAGGPARAMVSATDPPSPPLGAVRAFGAINLLVRPPPGQSANRPSYRHPSVQDMATTRDIASLDSCGFPAAPFLAAADIAAATPAAVVEAGLRHEAAAKGRQAFARGFDFDGPRATPGSAHASALAFVHLEGPGAPLLAATPGVLEFLRPAQLVPTDSWTDHGFIWIDAAESQAASDAATRLRASGYEVAFRPAAAAEAFVAARPEVDVNTMFCSTRDNPAASKRKPPSTVSPITKSLSICWTMLHQRRRREM